MIVGYSLLEGIGSALMIPPIYILITVLFSDTKTRAKYFGMVSGAAGLGAAAGPLIGGLSPARSAGAPRSSCRCSSWRWCICWPGSIDDPPRETAAPQFDLVGAILSAAGLFFVVFGILQSSTYGWFSSRADFTHRRHGGHPAGRDLPGLAVRGHRRAVPALVLPAHPLRGAEAARTRSSSTRLFRNRTSNLGLTTQTVQWLTMQGSFFVISVFLQQVRGYNAIQTGLMLTPTTIGVLLAPAPRGGWPGGGRSAS